MNARWYQNADLLRAARDEYGSLSAAARGIGGVSEAALQKWWRQLGMEKLQPGPAPRSGAVNEEALKRLYATVYGE